MVKANPASFRDPTTQAILPGDTIVQMRAQFIGEEKGLRALSMILTQRENELRERLKKQEQEQQNK